MPGFEPQTDVQLINVPVADPILAAAPVGTEVGLFIVPDNANFQVALLSVTVACNVLVVDGTDPVTVDIEWVDDSAADAVANLAAAFDLEAITVLVGNEVWRGSQILDPGDRVNAEFTRTTPDTAGQGYHFVVEYRILRRS